MYESFKENRTKIYKPDSLFILPYKFTAGRALVFNNRLHIIGGKNFNDNEGLKHYSWDGNSWRLESTLPYSFENGAAVAYNGKIHIMGSDADDSLRTNHYAWNGSTWSSVSTLPTTLYHGRGVVWNEKIHAVGFGTSHSYNYGHYSYDGTQWEFVSNIDDPKQDGGHTLFQYGALVVYNSVLVVISIYNRDPVYWDGVAWKEITKNGTVTYFGGNGCATATYNSSIYMMGGGGSSNVGDNGISKLTGTVIRSYTSDQEVLPYDVSFAELVEYNNKLYLVGGGDYTCKAMLDVTTLNTFF